MVAPGKPELARSLLLVEPPRDIDVPASGAVLDNWDCEDRALREISALVFNDQE